MSTTPLYIIAVPHIAPQTRFDALQAAAINVSQKLGVRLSVEYRGTSDFVQVWYDDAGNKETAENIRREILATA